MHSHHSHSGAFCSHASAGTSPWSMLEQAYKTGFTHYALTEHVPRQYAHELYPEEIDRGIGPSDLAATFERYLVEARKASQYWAGLTGDASNDVEQTPAPGRLNVLVGAETENIDARNANSIDYLCDTLALDVDQGRQCKVDFVVGSVHHVYGIPIDFDKPTFDKALQYMIEQDSETTDDLMREEGCQRAHLLLISAYLDAQHALINKIRPEVIGHFDLCRLFMPKTPMTAAGSASIGTADLNSLLADVDMKVRRNITLAVSYGALFEVNAASVRKGWTTPYPAEDVLDVILKLGGKLCLSDDAHAHEQVGLNYHVALQYLARKNVEHVWVLTRADEVEKLDETAHVFPRGTIAHRVPLASLASFARASA